MIWFISSTDVERGGSSLIRILIRDKLFMLGFLFIISMYTQWLKKSLRIEDG